MGHLRKRKPGPQQHAEGQHGTRTHERFVEQLHEAASPQDQDKRNSAEGRQRLHAGRQQHDAAEKNSEKVQAMREVQRGRTDENVLSQARIPRSDETG